MSLHVYAKWIGLGSAVECVCDCLIAMPGPYLPLPSLLQRAPAVLQHPAHRTNVLRVWVSAVLDKGGRGGARELTQVLAGNAAAAPLFAGFPLEEVRVWDCCPWP